MTPSAPTEAMPPTWHLCWQAAAGRDFLAEATVAARVRERLIDAHARPGRVLVYYLLAPTEIHVISAPAAGEGPGAIARAVGNIVARWVRQAQPMHSPVLAGRYRAHPIASVGALRHEARMLAWRPVVLGLCSTPSHHAHSALRTTLGLRRAEGFDARTVLQAFGETVPQARAALRSAIARRPSAAEARQWALERGLALATGTVGPGPSMACEVRGPAAALVAAAAVDGTGGIDGALALLERWVIARLGLRGTDQLRGATGHLGARGRALVACLATDLGLCSASSVARHFGRAKATLSEQMAACRARQADRLILAVPAPRIAEEAIALAPSAGTGSSASRACRIVQGACRRIPVEAHPTVCPSWPSLT